MKKVKRLKKIAKTYNIGVTCSSPFTGNQIIERHKEYLTLSKNDFMKKYRKHIFTPAVININGESHEIQFNYCINTFCKWYGMPQKKYDNIKGKPSRYKLEKGSKDGIHLIKCNNINDNDSIGYPIGNATDTVSNWSVAEEIKRLITINSIIPVHKVYEFHTQGCSNESDTPVKSPDLFYIRGKSSSNSTKYQCKVCKKITNVLPEQDECFGYHQRRNDILMQFTKDILNRTPVKRTCKKLNIGSSTYYNKLEWLYKKCLEFLERHETEAFKNKTFDEIWLNTDSFIYNLNNIKQKTETPKLKKRSSRPT